jgi:predicted amidophosphoribosyltransferase
MRVKNTLFQFELASSLRGSNLKGAFALNCKDKSLYEGKHILLVDDLLTTGSTIREATKVLLQLKPRKITVVVACRVI